MQCSVSEGGGGSAGRPNILFVISDDQSWPHASAYGHAVFQTPAFDRVAQQGVLFNNAFVAAPQCSPSRAALLTGLHIWQLEEAGTHSSYFPSKFEVFTQKLAQSGYAVGYTGKAWGPGNFRDAGWSENPVGKAWNERLLGEVPYTGIHKLDYVGNFRDFLDARGDSEPFFFWFGAHEPHRDYEYGTGKRPSPDIDIPLPAFLPRTDSIVQDMLDYALEIAWFDQQLDSMLQILEQRGELDNTIVVVTSDNGMAFPHAKASLQEYGIHVPLAICGPGIPGQRSVDDMVSLIDLAPTFLEAAGAENLKKAEGRSLMPLLRSNRSGVIDSTRDYILAGRERHTHARPDNLGYPARAIRNHDYLYIRNFAPDRWPMGDPPPATFENVGDDPEMKPIVVGFEDIDDSPTKRIMIRRRGEWPDLFQTVFEKRPTEQLYDIRRDPDCLRDLSQDPAYAKVLTDLRGTLDAALTSQGDPRMLGSGSIFDAYPRFGRMRPFPGFRKRGEYNQALMPSTNP